MPTDKYSSHASFKKKKKNFLQKMETMIEIHNW